MMQLNIVWSRLPAAFRITVFIVAFCSVSTKVSARSSEQSCLPNASSKEAAKTSRVWCRKAPIEDKLNISYFGDGTGGVPTQSSIVYVWKKNGEILQKDTNPNLSIRITSLEDYGVYQSNSNSASYPENTTYFVLPEKCQGNCSYHDSRLE